MTAPHSDVIDTIQVDVVRLGPRVAVLRQALGTATLTSDDGTEHTVYIDQSLTGMQIFTSVDGGVMLCLDLAPHIQHLCELAVEQPTRQSLRDAEEEAAS